MYSRGAMYRSISSVALSGIDGVNIRVEADVRNGLPSFELVGYLTGQVKEAGERVRSALYNSGYFLEPKRVLINLSPADVRKEGNAFDLPIAIAILCSILPIPEEAVEDAAMVGELGLNGQVHPVHGVLVAALAARAAGKRRIFVPEQNKGEAAVVEGLSVFGVGTLREAVELLAGVREKRPERSRGTAPQGVVYPDFSEVMGQQAAKRAVEVAAAGMHNLLLLGSAGSGKTMLAKRIPGILPPLSVEESLEVSRIYSVAGLLSGQETMVWARPFRAPHHSIPRVAMAGGGRSPKAGEISLAHCGVLFLDELPEFSKDTLEALRQPMEEGAVTITRLQGAVRFPADFLLVGAMNLCRCGHYPDRVRCRCDEGQIRRYVSRVSGPLLDRMDLFAVMEPVSFLEISGQAQRAAAGRQDMTARGAAAGEPSARAGYGGDAGAGFAEPSAAIRGRVEAAWQIQQERFRGLGIRFNSQMSGRQAEEFCALGRAEWRMVEEAFARLGISARVYHKLLKVARTVADLEGAGRVSEKHLCEAIQYRSTASRIWG